MKNKINYNYLICIFIFALFFMMSYYTPLAGDDWGYAINGMKQNPLLTTYEFYMSWSGRVFSELYGFLVAPNKWFWNIFNSLLFAGIFYFIIKIVKTKKIVVGLTVLFLMLFVKDSVRMETYTWIMGTTYIIPLFLFLLYTYIMKKLIIDNHSSKYLWILSGIICFYIPLCMENIAVVLIIANLMLLGYCYFENKSLIKKILACLTVSVISFAILRLSPGASIRLLGEHAAWTDLTLFEQIAINWPNFIKFTFLENKYLIMMLSLIFSINIFQNRKKIKLYPILLLINLLVFIQSISANIFSKVNLSFLTIFFDMTNPYCIAFTSILFTLFMISIFYVVFNIYDKKKMLLCYFVIICAGAANGSMLLSPIYSSRSSIFTIYLIILLCAILIDSLKINKVVHIIFIIILILGCFMKSKEYHYKYTLVKEIDNERMGIVQYYIDNPQDDDAWIPRMPIMTIHSADVEQWDTYHMDTFKAYYGIPTDTKLNFFAKESYGHE